MQFKARKAPKYTKNSNNIEKFQTLISHSATSQTYHILQTYLKDTQSIITNSLRREQALLLLK